MDASISKSKQRRTHKKSRLGCFECKKRRIKCDETQPMCLNCAVRGVICSSPSSTKPHKPDSVSIQPDKPHGRNLRFIPSAYCTSFRSSNQECRINSDRVDSPTSRTSLVAFQKRVEALECQVAAVVGYPTLSNLTYQDMELWHHFYVYTSHAMIHSGDDESRNFWQLQLPNMSFEHPHILHLTLGFCALHRGRLSPERRDRLFMQGMRHHMLGIRGTAEILNHFGSTNYEAAWISSIMIMLFNYGLGPQPGEYMGFSKYGQSSFIHILRGLHCISKAKYGNQKSSDQADSTWNATSRSSAALTSLEKNPHNLHPGLAYLLHLKDAISRSIGIANDESPGVYLNALDALVPFMGAAFQVDHDYSKYHLGIYKRVPMAWLSFVETIGYVNYLERKSPLALAIFACWATVIEILDTGWTLQGWSTHIVHGVWECLSAKYKSLISWPFEYVSQRPLN
jgi:hypothetical protein